ncbi:MAG: hypothetical protein SPC22_09060 [Ruminococcus bromii]|nr:hypothetical protein [Ruminococcus bromii]
MKTTSFKKLTALLVAVVMVFSMCVTGVSVSAATDSSTTTVYLKPNANWTQTNARFAAYLWNDNGNTWVDATDTDGDGYYEVAVPSGYNKVIFTRMNPATKENNWDTKWNQTSDLSIPTDGKNLYTIAEGAWDEGNGEWSTYNQSTSTSQVETTSAPSNTTYLQVNKNWAEGNARFAAYLWNDNGNTWVDATKTSDNVYAVTVPDGYTNVIFTRMNPATTENNWSDVWNQTADLKVELGKVYVMAEGAWDKGNGEWKNFDQPETTAPATEAPATTVAPTTEAPTTAPANTTYLQVNKNWAESNARFAAYLWNDNGNTWVSATKTSDNVYAVTVPDGYTNVIFTRMNPATTENNWSDVWNQTADLKVELGKVYVMAEGAWDKGNGEWKNFDQPATTAPATEPATEATTAPATEAPTTAPANTTYLKVNANWAQANARFAAYLWNDNGNTWVSATKYADGVYAVAVPDGYTNIIFTRMNPATTENNWSDAWNQTADLKVELGKVYVMAEGAWDKGEGEWKNLDQPATTAPATEPATTAPATTAPVTEPTTAPASGVSVFGDINLDLVKGSDDVYTASTDLEKGTYSFRINNNGTTYCNGATFTDKTTNVAYSTKWKAATKLVANGGTYTFKYNVSTNKLSIEYQAPSLAQIFGDINLDLQATKDANIYSAAIDLKAGSYDFRVMNQGVQYCCKYTYKDITVGSQYNAKWKSASTLVAQGGTYTFSYDIDANKLTISYLPEGAAVSIIGDFTLALQPTENPNVYTATQELKAGSYVIKVNNFGKICGASGVVNDEKSAIVFNPKWSRYTTLKATGGTYTFTYDVSKNVLSIAKEK